MDFTSVLILFGKYAVLSVHFIILGFLMFTMGILVLANYQEVSDDQMSLVTYATIGIVVLSTMVTTKDTRWLLIIYSILMLILACYKFYVGVIVFQYQNNVESIGKQFVHEAFAKTNLRSFHRVEAIFECCGVTGPESYKGILEHLPVSCCRELKTDPNVDLTKGVCTPETAFRGCLYVLPDRLNIIVRCVTKFIVGIIMLELVAALIAIWVHCTVLSCCSSNVANTHFNRIIGIDLS